MTMEKLSGDWIVVEGTGSTYVKTANAITEAVTKLRIIADEEQVIALGFTKLRSSAREVADQIQQATSRYDTTGTALVDYAAGLRTAQSLADEAIERYTTAHSAMTEAAAEQNRIERMPEAESPAATTQRESLFDDQAGILNSQSRLAGDAEDDWRAAERLKNDAAEATIAKIRDEIEDSDLNDSFWDNVWGGIKGFFEAIGDAIVKALKWLETAALVVLVVVVVAIVALALLASGGLLAFLVGGLILTLLTLWVVGGGPDAFITNYLKTGDYYSAFIASVIATGQNMFPGLLAKLVAGDDGSPEWRWSGTGDAIFRFDGTPGEYLSRLQAGNIDADGQVGAPGDLGLGLTSENSSMITVTQVVHADGSVSYRVNIPSTQQWGLGTSSINDIHSDAAAKLSPEQQTQLAQAVKDAMNRANVPPGADVLLSGWSLGGITAGNLAGDPDFTSSYNVKGVIVSGSSVDDIPIPKHIPVLTFSHSDDPVPRTENPERAWHGDDSNRTNVVVDPPPGTSYPGHDGAAYQKTIESEADTPGSSSNEFFDRNGLDEFFTGIETPHSSIYQRGE